MSDKSLRPVKLYFGGRQWLKRTRFWFVDGVRLSAMASLQWTNGRAPF